MNTSKEPIGRVEFLGLLSSDLSPRRRETVEAAYMFSKGGHNGQQRENGERYFEHPKAVALILIVELGIINWKMICTALMHDLLEDTYILSGYRIKLNFGGDVKDWVEICTKRTGKDYYGGLWRAPWQALMVKLCDRLHNLRTLGHCSPAKQKRKIAETREHYLPLADRLVTIVPRQLRPQAKLLRKLMLAAIAELES